MGVETLIGGIGAGANAISGINSGIKGKQANRKLQHQMEQANERFGGMADFGMGVGQNISGILDGMDPHDQSRANQAGDIYGQGYQNNVNIPGAMHQMHFDQPGMQQFDFGQVSQIADQSVQAALAAGDSARVSARENMAMQTGGMQDQLGAALAAQGLNPNSGAMTSALGEQARAGMQQMGALERDIAGMADQAALTGAQMDNQNLMSMAGMGSQYNLGMNQLEQQSALGAFQSNLAAQQQHFGQGMAGAQLQAGIDQSRGQYDLGRAQGLAGLQGMQNDMVTGLSGILGGLGGQMGGIGAQGINSLLGMQGDAVAGAADGKGAGLGAALGFLPDALGGIEGKKTQNQAVTGNWGNTNRRGGPTGRVTGGRGT